MPEWRACGPVESCGRQHAADTRGGAMHTSRVACPHRAHADTSVHCLSTVVYDSCARVRMAAFDASVSACQRPLGRACVSGSANQHVGDLTGVHQHVGVFVGARLCCNMVCILTRDAPPPQGGCSTFRTKTPPPTPNTAQRMGGHGCGCGRGRRHGHRNEHTRSRCSTVSGRCSLPHAQPPRSQSRVPTWHAGEVIGARGQEGEQHGNTVMLYPLVK